ncbi:Ligand-Gated ion Channel [Caenorhabditis elegans]|uniref:Ligand-Gated ion Channel n=1 Tax=Caenorhabditis elegans TaxID=6239 RepID=A0A4V0IN65_CAEEL|nr:Ligand-Gated ion Channel [Caenorhabditis elegans]VTW47510.1 Ligand-Gated ion Channel [Caenorhabditis elegans]
MKKYWSTLHLFQVLCIFIFIRTSSPLTQPNIYNLLQQSNTRPPTANASVPLGVKLGMYLESLGNFRSSEMSFDVDLYVYMSWQDPRLAHNFSDYVLINNDEIRKQIWLPDLYFANARQASFQEVTVPNFNLFVAPDGTVAYSCRCTLTVACSLNLRYYPMDQQLCSIRVLSYAYIAKQVNVTWFDKNPVRFNEEIGLPEFQIEHVSNAYCNGSYQYALTENSYKSDDFSCLSGNLFLSRSIGYNLVQSYIPTGLIVMISWVSFWIDRRAVPARVTLSFTTLVSLTTLGNGLRFGLPQVSYAKAIDLWYGACMFFVFCALLEFATINSYMRKSEKFDSMAKKMQSVVLTGRRGAAGNVVDALNDDWCTYSTENGRKSFSAMVGDIFERAGNAISPRRNRYRGLKTEKSPRGYGKPDTVQDILSERIKFIDNEFDFDTKEDDEIPGNMAMSIYDNVSCRKDEADSSSEETKFSTKPKRNGTNGTRKYIDKSLNQSGQNDSLIVATYFQISANHSRHALKIDKSCRYLFPAAFLLWNVFYWWYYLVYTKTPIDK